MPKNINAALVGTFIRNQREKRNLSQGDLASLSGVSLNFLSQLENGKESIRLSKLLDITAALGIKIKLSLGSESVEI